MTDKEKLEKIRNHCENELKEDYKWAMQRKSKSARTRENIAKVQGRIDVFVEILQILNEEEE